MKILIIDNSVIGQVVKTILDQYGTVLLTSHEDALETFLLEEPDRVLICECWQSSDGKAKNVSKSTTEDIFNSADETVMVKTMGLSDYAFGRACDIPLPVDIEDILQSLKIGGVK